MSLQESNIGCCKKKRKKHNLWSSTYNLYTFLWPLKNICYSYEHRKPWFPFMGTRTASPRGRYGERPQRDSVWRYIWKNTTCWPATAHDVTTGVPQYKCRREDTSSAFSSSLTGLFEACRVNLVRVQFSNSTMASTSKAFRKCVDPCPRYVDTQWHTRLLRLLFGHGARTRCPWGGGLRALWAALYEEAQLSPVPLFEERGAAVCFPRFKTHRCRGTEANEIVGFAVGGGR